MRKLQIICENTPNMLMKHVNEYFEKLDKSGYQVIKTDYAKEDLGSYVAFIDYEKKPQAK